MGASRWNVFRRIDPARRAAVGAGRHGRQHRHHLGGGRRRRNDLGRRRGRVRGAGRGPRLLHLELVRRRLVPADRRRHDLDRHRRVPLQRGAAPPVGPADALAEGRRDEPPVAPWRREDLRPGTGDPRGGAGLFVRRRGREVHGDDRPLGRRQEHTHSPHRRLRTAHPRRDPGRRPPRHGPWPGSPGGVSRNGALPVDDSRREPAVRPEGARRDGAGRAAARRRPSGPGRPSQLPRPVPASPVRRHATPGRAGPRHGERPGRHDPGRAVPRARRPDQAADARVLRRPGAGAAAHELLRHHRRRRGDLPGRPTAGHDPHPDARAGRDRRRPAAAARSGRAGRRRPRERDQAAGADAAARRGHEGLRRRRRPTAAADFIAAFQRRVSPTSPPTAPRSPAAPRPAPQTARPAPGSRPTH